MFYFLIIFDWGIYLFVICDFYFLWNYIVVGYWLLVLFSVLKLKHVIFGPLLLLLWFWGNITSRPSDGVIVACSVCGHWMAQTLNFGAVLIWSFLGGKLSILTWIKIYICTSHLNNQTNLILFHCFGENHSSNHVTLVLSLFFILYIFFRM